MVCNAVSIPGFLRGLLCRPALLDCRFLLSPRLASLCLARLPFRPPLCHFRPSFVDGNQSAADTPLSEDEEEALHLHGFGSSALGDSCPTWLKKFAAMQAWALESDRERCTKERAFIVTNSNPRIRGVLCRVSLLCASCFSTYDPNFSRVS